MNLFSDYQKKIFISLKKLEKKKIILIPENIKNFSGVLLLLNYKDFLRRTVTVKK